MTDLQKLSPAMGIIAASAAALGARVTSGYRTPEVNASVGGAPDSLHLKGEALDLGLDAPPVVVAFVKSVADIQRHEKGTGPHWHVEERPYTLPLLLAGLTLLGVVAHVATSD